MDAFEDTFAEFLQEVGGVDGTPAPEASQSDGAHEEDLGAKRRRTEAAAGQQSMPPADTAAALRKAAYQGEQSKVEQILTSLSVVDRLLLIDSLDQEDGFAALHLAVIGGHRAAAKALVKYRADVDLPTQSGDTPLMWAAHVGHLGLCRELLRLGADAEAKAGGRTAAVRARLAGHQKVCLLLEGHVSDVKAERAVASAAPPRCEVPDSKEPDSKERAAELRRAANAALIAEAIRSAEAEKEEEAFWAEIRTRKEARESSGDHEDTAARKAYTAGKQRLQQEEEDAEWQRRAAEVLPAKLRPHYRLLDLAPDATEPEVRKAYRRLALKHHPDKNPQDTEGAKALFTKVAMAYEAICEHLSHADQSGRGVRVAPPASY